MVNNRDIHPNLLNEINDNPQNFYYLDFATTIQTVYYDYHPLFTLPKNYYKNSLYFCGVTNFHPEITKVLKANNKENMALSLVDDNTYFVDNVNYEIKLNYIREHYYPEARIELIKELDGYKIWKIYKK